VFGVDEVQFRWSERERLPVEAAFEEKGETGVFGALEALFPVHRSLNELHKALARDWTREPNTLSKQGRGIVR
jgi:hypothetical protein